MKLKKMLPRWVVHLIEKIRHRSWWNKLLTHLYLLKKRKKVEVMKSIWIQWEFKTCVTKVNQVLLIHLTVKHLLNYLMIQQSKKGGLAVILINIVHTVYWKCLRRYLNWEMKIQDCYRFITKVILLWKSRIIYNSF